MRATLAFCCAAIVAASVVLSADDRSVIFDEDVDFSTFKTFAVKPGAMTSARPELNFPAVMGAIGERVRSALTAKGLKAVTDGADLAVTFTVTGVDYSIGPFGRPNAVRPGQRGRGLPVDFTEATLVLDLSRTSPDALVWRGVFHDTEKEARKLAEALPKDAAELLSEYPKLGKK